MELTVEQRKADPKWRRNIKILQQVATGAKKADIAREFNLTPMSIQNVIRKYGGRDVVLEKFARSEAGRLVPLVDESDVLKSGMAAAQDKLSKVFIRMALELNEDEMSTWKPGTKLKFLAILGPLLKQVAKPMAPTNVNFFLKNAQSNEDLEHRMLEWATGGAKKSIEE